MALIFFLKISSHYQKNVGYIPLFFYYNIFSDFFSFWSFFNFWTCISLFMFCILLLQCCLFNVATFSHFVDLGAGSIHGKSSRGRHPPDTDLDEIRCVGSLHKFKILCEILFDSMYWFLICGWLKFCQIVKKVVSQDQNQDGMDWHFSFFKD